MTMLTINNDSLRASLILESQWTRWHAHGCGFKLLLLNEFLREELGGRNRFYFCMQNSWQKCLPFELSEAFMWLTECQDHVNMSSLIQIVALSKITFSNFRIVKHCLLNDVFFGTCNYFKTWKHTNIIKKYSRRKKIVAFSQAFSHFFSVKLS